MPHIKLVGRDVAHATTKFLKRPFQKSEAIHSLMEEWCHGSDSFAQKVFHSPLLNQWWAQSVHEPEDDPVDTCASLSAAKHRFTSYLQPLSRICKNLQAALKVCGQVQAMRGSDAAWAARLCRTFNGFKAAFVGMAADAASLCNDFGRYADKEDIDVAELNMKANNFMVSARTLFVEKKVLTLPSFTKEMVERPAPWTVMQDGFASEITITTHDLDKAFKIIQDQIILFVFECSTNSPLASM